MTTAVLMQLARRCFCCGARSMQAAYGSSNGFRSIARQATLDGADVARRLHSGIELCPECGLAAPSIEQPAPGLNAARVRAIVASPEYQTALGNRREAHDARPKGPASWLAYAVGFTHALPPEQAGWAWVNAAAELEVPGRQDGDEADATRVATARHAAATHLRRVFEADFPRSGPWPAWLARAIRRRAVGEPAFRPSRLAFSDEGMVVEERHHGRFETACALADLLRRAGDFRGCEGVARRALQDEEAPAYLADVLRFQIRLSQARNSTRYTFRDAAEAFGLAAALGEGAETGATGHHPQPLLPARHFERRRSHGRQEPGRPVQAASRRRAARRA